MSFWGAAFVFNGVPSEAFGLMMYDVGGASDGETSFASNVTVVEETVGRRWKPYFYGSKFENKLEFDITFGVNQHRIDENRPLDRYELAEIASWLTGHHGYQELIIDQPDMDQVRYKCMITGLHHVEYGKMLWALKATVTCDSPFAYLPVMNHVFNITSANQLITVNNVSSLNGYFYPIVEFVPGDGVTDLRIENVTDRNRALELEDIPSSISKITIDNDHCIISNDQDINLYSGCNCQFLRLVRGYNTLKITGNGALTIRCEFPIDVGG